MIDWFDQEIEIEMTYHLSVDLHMVGRSHLGDNLNMNFASSEKGNLGHYEDLESLSPDLLEDQNVDHIHFE